MDTPAEATGQTLQVGFIQGLVGAGQRPPPGAEAAALLTQREVAVEHDSINTVIATVEELVVVGTEIVNLFHGYCALARDCLFTQSLGMIGQARHQTALRIPQT
jgi:hypothetical protein